MIEFKFRMWNPDGKWFQYFTIGTKWSDYFFSCYNVACIMGKKFDQFTGRKIGEKDLYCGDIVYITIFDCLGGDKQYLCRVEWWGSAFWLVSVKNEEDRWELDWALSQDDEPEIRGNIHKNPELLK